MQLHSEERSSAGVYLVVACDWGEQFYAWCHGVSLSQHHLAALYGHVYISGESCIVAHHLPCLGAITPYGGNSFSLMTILENLDTDDFDGALAAVITQNGVIKKVLKEESLNVKGYAGSKSGTAYVTMRDITATADEIHAGGAALFRVKLHNGGDDMQLKSVVVAMTSKANPEEVITGKISASVYEESDYNASVLVALPETATPV